MICGCCGAHVVSDRDGGWVCSSGHRMPTHRPGAAQVDVLRAQVAAVRALHSRDERKAAMGLNHCAGCSTHVTFTPWPCKTVQALDAPPDVTR